MTTFPLNVCSFFSSDINRCTITSFQPSWSYLSTNRILSMFINVYLYKHLCTYMWRFIWVYIKEGESRLPDFRWRGFIVDRVNPRSVTKDYCKRLFSLVNNLFTARSWLCLLCVRLGPRRIIIVLIFLHNCLCFGCFWGVITPIYLPRFPCRLSRELRFWLCESRCFIYDIYLLLSLIFY